MFPTRLCYIISMILVMSLVCVGCTNTRNDTTVQSTKYGEISSTILKGPDGSLYYVNPTDGWKIYKWDIESDKIQKVNNANTISFTFYNDYIYYSARDTLESKLPCLFKMKLDGSDGEIVLRNIRGFFAVTNGRIYYIDCEDDALYKVQLDGSEENRVYYGSVESFQVYNGSLYFLKLSDEDVGYYELFHVKDDGTELQKIIEDTIPGSIRIFDGWVYLSNGESKISKVRLDGSSFCVIIEDIGSIISAENGWVYYRLNDTNGIHRVKFDGCTRERVSSINFSEITFLTDDILCAVNNFIYTIDMNTKEEKIYKLQVP